MALSAAKFESLDMNFASLESVRNCTRQGVSFLDWHAETEKDSAKQQNSYEMHYKYTTHK